MATPYTPTVERIGGTQGSSNTAFARQVLRAGTQYTLDISDDQVTVDVPGVTLTLPVAPYTGEKHLVLCDDGSCTVKGGTKEIIGGDVGLEHGQGASFCFSSGGNWIQTSQSPNSAKDYLTQPLWFIDPIAGKDTNKGNTISKALKTWAEWQKRVGVLNVLNPVGGALQINVIGSLPDTDPATFRSLMAPGTTAYVQGTVITVKSNQTITAWQNRDRQANKPWVVTATVPGGFGAYVGKVFQFKTGPLAGVRAWIVDALSATQAELSNLVSAGPAGYDGFTFPEFGGDAPISGVAPGIKFDILDYGTLTPGPSFFGVDMTQAPLFPGGLPVGSLVFTQFRVTQSFPFLMSSPTTLGGAVVICAYADCTFEVGMVAASFATSFANCLFGVPGQNLDCSSAASYNFFVEGAFVDTLLYMEQGTKQHLDGDVAIIRGNISAVEGSVINLGPTYWKACGEPLNLQNSLAYGGNSTQFQETNFTPYWGVCDTEPDRGSLIVGNNSQLSMIQFSDAGVRSPLPSLVAGGAAVSNIIFLPTFFGPFLPKGVYWDQATSTMLPVGGMHMPWAKFPLAANGLNTGGFHIRTTVDGGFTVEDYNALCPQATQSVVWASAWV